jgi:predicted lipoprotein with Yx(FWY)xxD motif
LIGKRAALVAALTIVGLTCIVTAWASSTTEVKLVNAGGGHVLGQQSGYTLYVYCSGLSNTCKKGRSSPEWPPMIAYHHPVAGKGINQKKLGTKLLNGRKVVTYYGQPLFRYRGDKKPGQDNGQAKQQGNGAWYVVSRLGHALPVPSY